MAYNKILEEKVERVLTDWADVNKKKMFGGVCYLINGNICFGIYKDYLIVRTEKHFAEQKLREDNVKPFDITGKPLKGWLMVEEAGWKSAGAITNWLEIGRQFALSLPAK
jgi:TfoX/Sxy family transcriptional regulator of competence genes